MGVTLGPAPLDNEEALRDGGPAALVPPLLMADPVNPFFSFPVDAITKAVRIDEQSVAKLCSRKSSFDEFL